MSPDAALDYLDFVTARQEVWVARQLGQPQPWTDNPIVARKKFTNVYRVLDHGSQYVLTGLVDPELDERGQLMRLFLYRHTGRVEAWEWLDLTYGLPNGPEDLDGVLAAWTDYRGASRASSSGPTYKGGKSSISRVFERSLFTSAYLVFPQTTVKGTDKLTSIVELTRRLFDPRSPDDVVPDFMAAGTQAQRFNALRRNKGVADFMSMQTLTDWGYTPHCGEDRENEFVVAGPGARKGAAVLDPGGKVEDTLSWAFSAVSKLPGLALPGGRKPSLMDVQNTLCEFSKYARYQQRPLSPERQYKPAHPGVTSYQLPAHW